MTNTLHHTITEKKDTIFLNFQQKELEKLPLKVAMRTLEILKKNNSMVGYFVEFNEEAQNFISKNKEKWENDSSLESENFKKLSKVYFDEMSGPLYVYGNRVLEVVSKVYEVEPLVLNVKFKNFSITHTLKNEEDSSFDKVLMVKNTQDMIERFGKAITLHTLSLYKDHLNFEYQRVNKVNKIPYGLSVDIKRKCFNTTKNTHEFLEKLSGKNYILDDMFDSHMKKMSSPESILELLIIREYVKDCLKNPQDKYEVKPNASSQDDIWYMKNNIIHREGDLPARESNGGFSWYKNGLVHRDDDLPSFVSSNSKAWSKNGLDHRDGDLPAKVVNDGQRQSWFKEGKLHRVGNPAIIEEPFSYNMGKEEWWNEGKKHREDGPAVTYIKKDKSIDRVEWWLDGVEFSEEDFKHELSKRDLNKKLNEDLTPNNKKERKNKI